MAKDNHERGSIEKCIDGLGFVLLVLIELFCDY